MVAQRSQNSLSCGVWSCLSIIGSSSSCCASTTTADSWSSGYCTVIIICYCVFIPRQWFGLLATYRARSATSCLLLGIGVLMLCLKLVVTQFIDSSPLLAILLGFDPGAFLTITSGMASNSACIAWSCKDEFHLMITKDPLYGSNSNHFGHCLFSCITYHCYLSFIYVFTYFVDEVLFVYPCDKLMKDLTSLMMMRLHLPKIVLFLM